MIHFIKRNFNPKKLKRRLLHFALQGNNVQCPCCGARYITFLPAGIVKRANAACINCGSLERHRLLWLFMKQQGELFSKKIKLLHVAPEKLYYKKFASLDNIEYYPTDLNPAGYGYGKKTLKMDITGIKFNDDFFDVIICNHVLEHVPDDTKAMREMHRVLKPGCWALINVPIDMSRENTFEDVNINDPKKQLELFGQPDHVRIYGKDYITRLQDAGFAVEVIDYAKNFDEATRFKYGLKASELIFLCRKTAG